MLDRVLSLRHSRLSAEKTRIRQEYAYLYSLAPGSDLNGLEALSGWPTTPKERSLNAKNREKRITALIREGRQYSINLSCQQSEAPGRLSGPQSTADGDVTASSGSSNVDYTAIMEEACDKHGLTGENRKVAMAAMATMVGAGALLAPSRAEASVAAAAASAIASQMESIMDSVVNNVTGAFTSIFQDSGDRVMATMARTSDAIIQNNTELENENIRREAAPPPHACQSNEIAARTTRAGQASEVTAANGHQRIANDSESMTNPARSIINTSKRRDERFGSGENKNKDLNPAYLTKDSGFESDVEREAAQTFMHHVRGQSHTRNLAPSKTMNPQQLAIAKSFQLTSIARSSVAMQPMMRSISSRVQTDSGGGLSEMALLKAEIDRTYGGADWREQIEALMGTVPLLIEQLKITSLSNKLLHKELQLTEEANLIAGTHLLEVLERDNGKG